MIIDKLRYKTLDNKKIIYFLFGLSIIGLIMGSFFTTILSSSDKSLTQEYISNFMNNIISKNTNYISVLINSFFSNSSFILLIWLLGISIIGIPIVLFMFFSKIFIVSFSVSSFILTYKFKGLLLAFFYVFPSHIFSLIIYLLVSLYSIKMSVNLIHSIFKKKEVNLKKFIKRYLIILGIGIIGIVISSLYETFVVPFILSKLAFLVK